MSALAKDPSNKTPDAARIQNRIDFLKKRRPNDPQIAKLQAKLGSLPPSDAAPPGTPTYQDITGAANQGIQNSLGYINQQGAFNPGDFNDLQQKGYDTAMDAFNRSMDPQFKQQEADWQQMAAERGWDPTSKAFADAHTMQITDPQNNARQQAMDSAFGQGLNAQQQAWGQAYQQYQMPYQNLQAFSPYYQGQTQFGMQNDQQRFLASQANLDREQQWKVAQLAAAHSGGGKGGGGGLTLADQLALQNNQFYNAMAMSALQGGGGYQPTVGNGFAQGIGAGTGAFIGSALR